MDPLAYLTTPAAGVGALEWVFLGAQVVVAIAGLYFAFLHTAGHPVRARALRQLGYALLAVGVVGAIVGGLRVAGVAPFTMPLWIAVATLFNVALALFAAYYASNVLPGQVQAHDLANRSRAGRPARPSPALDTARAAQRAQVRPAAETNGVVTPIRPPSGRRDARRDRKRKSK